MHNIIKYDENPASWLWEGNITEENLRYAKQTINQLNSERLEKRPSSSLSKENLEKIPEHKWLNKCECVLLDPAETRLSDFIETLLAEAETIQEEVLLKEPKKVLAFDLETIGLNQTIKFVGGERVTYNSVVGICVATSKFKGYYIPVLHNETGKVKNYDEGEAREFLQKLVEEFHLIIHNAVFDLEILTLFGVKTNRVSFTDTLLIAGHKGYKIEFFSIGLKQLSEILLDRKMLSINEIMNEKKSAEIRLTNIPAENAFVYGCSDAMNTLGLFYYMIEEDNPYELQKNATKLDHRMVKYVRSLYRVGLPINYETAKKTLATMFRRLMIMGAILRSHIKDDINISSPEQMGTYIYKILKRNFEKHYGGGEEVIYESKAFQALSAKVRGDFDMEVKAKETKKDGLKITANFSDSVINGILYNLEEWDFIPEKERESIYIICEAMSLYRSLAHEIGILRKMVQFSYNDDMNMSRCGISLKLNGADTTRFANASSKNGSFNSIVIKENSRGASIYHKIGNGVTGFNCQGVSSSPGKWRTLKCVDVSKFPEELRAKLRKTEKQAEAYMKASILSDYLETGE